MYMWATLSGLYNTNEEIINLRVVWHGRSGKWEEGGVEMLQYSTKMWISQKLNFLNKKVLVLLAQISNTNEIILVFGGVGEAM